MAYVTLKLNKKRLLKMPQDHIREFLQVTLKQAWDQDDNIIVKHLQASKRDLAKRQCLLPPQAMPGQSCSLDQQPVNVPEQPVPAPTTLQGTETAQALEPLCPHPESSAPLAETPPVEPVTAQLQQLPQVPGEWPEAPGPPAPGTDLLTDPGVCTALLGKKHYGDGDSIQYFSPTKADMQSNAFLHTSPKTMPSVELLSTHWPLVLPTSTTPPPPGSD
ncbi:uncharacterized protein LOC131483075 [Ochotona princeps]|uniref:uncharacterized protein LOC131483075 n=1 Tax=Ochotona princeps TaxID=9978 RepID=UPI002714D1D4|nr:uncharacterized protein LOC131483075 [Ochotona princeps]